VTLRLLIALAYRLQPFQLSGGPAWLNSEYFDINTEAAEKPSEDRLFLMIQGLLAERFSLKTHFETATAARVHSGGSQSGRDTSIGPISID